MGTISFRAHETDLKPTSLNPKSHLICRNARNWIASPNWNHGVSISISPSPHFGLLGLSNDVGEMLIRQDNPKRDLGCGGRSPFVTTDKWLRGRIHLVPVPTCGVEHAAAKIAPDNVAATHRMEQSHPFFSIPSSPGKRDKLVAAHAPGVSALWNLRSRVRSRR
jgi:hypothetical protein